MYCNNCEKEMLTNFKFCPVCGKPPQPANNPTQMYGNTPNPIPPNNPNNPNNQNNYYNNNYYQNANPVIGLKDETVTLVLSIVLGLFGLSGIGHMYVGKIGKGIGILIGEIMLWIIGIGLTIFIITAIIGIPLMIAAFALFIWQIIDAKKLCRQYNDHLRRIGSPPW